MESIRNVLIEHLPKEVKEEYTDEEIDNAIKKTSNPKHKSSLD